jgi:[acyl-carrier-protein] S-malonyltransferase
MGQDLAERFPAARAVFAEADAALDYPLARLMWDGPEAELTLTHNAQPAILVHSLAVHAVVRERLDAVAGAGHSLGEYTAYAVVGALGLPDAGRLVRRRGTDARRRRTRPGTMAAVIGMDGDRVTEICASVARGRGRGRGQPERARPDRDLGRSGSRGARRTCAREAVPDGSRRSR